MQKERRPAQTVSEGLRSNEDCLKNYFSVATTVERSFKRAALPCKSRK